MGFVEDLRTFFEDIHNISENDIGSKFISIWGEELVLGTNLFFFFFPETPDDVIIIMPRSRPNRLRNTPCYNPAFDFIVRSIDKLKAFKTAELLTFIFDKRGGILSPNSMSYIGSGTPTAYYLDERGRQTFTNYVWFNSIIYNVEDL